LTTIATAARDGLSAMHGEAPADLEALLHRTRAAGLTVSAEVADLDLAPPQVRLLVCRIIQEALTNVLRHAPGAPAEVVVRRHGTGITVAVTNAAPRQPGAERGAQRGLVGLRERVTADAGELRWGPREGGGFEVFARLPARRLEGADR
jgi:signal transduction histidine kinase